MTKACVDGGLFKGVVVTRDTGFAGGVVYAVGLFAQDTDVGLGLFIASANSGQHFACALGAHANLQHGLYAVSVVVFAGNDIDDAANGF